MTVRLHLPCTGTPEERPVFILCSPTVTPSLCISYYAYLLSNRHNVTAVLLCTAPGEICWGRVRRESVQPPSPPTHGAQAEGPCVKLVMKLCLGFCNRSSLVRSQLNEVYLQVNPEVMQTGKKAPFGDAEAIWDCIVAAPPREHILLQDKSHSQEAASVCPSHSTGPRGNLRAPVFPCSPGPSHFPITAKQRPFYLFTRPRPS